MTGDAVNVAARLEQAAGALEVLIGEPTYRLVRDHVDVEAVEPLELKGKSERVPAYRLIGVRDEPVAARVRSARSSAASDELEQLRLALGEAVTAGSPRLATIVADAGVGKSRLIEELARIVGDEAQILRGRCLAYGRGITFWPVRELLHQAAEIAPSDSPDVAIAKITELAGEDAAARLAGAVGLSERQYPVDEVFWGVRQLLERLAARGPVVFVVEDVHWAEQTLLDLLEQLLRSCEAPLLIVAATRPTLFETRQAWGEHERARLIELRAAHGRAQRDRRVEPARGQRGAANARREDRRRRRTATRSTSSSCSRTRSRRARPRSTRCRRRSTRCCRPASTR